MQLKQANKDQMSFKDYEYEQNKTLMQAMQATRVKQRNAEFDMEALQNEMAYAVIKQNMNQITQALDSSRKNEYFKPYGFGRGDSIFNAVTKAGK